MKHYDALVIGTGQAGPSLAARIAGAGWKTAIVERDKFGGTCVNYGCIPTKTIVAAARVAHEVRRSAQFGIETSGPVTVDMTRVKLRKDAIVRQSSEGVEAWLRSTEGLDVITGHARFVGPKTIEVDGERYSADKIFINVGGRAAMPPVPGLETVDALTNSGILDLDFVPEHLIVLGGSYIGIEFAQAFRRFGSEVTIVERAPRLIGREDPETSNGVREILESEGIRVITGAECISVSPGEHQQGKASGVRLSVSCEEPGTSRGALRELPTDTVAEPVEVLGSHLLVATGRRPNTDELGLELAGVRTGPGGYIVVSPDLKTSAEGIWALGDVNGRGAFTHTSYNDYEIVAANLLDGESRRVTDRISAYALYMDPPLGRVGMTEAEARATGRILQIARRPMSKVARAVQKGETAGFMKVIVDADSKEILGFTILGMSGDEVLHTVLAHMYAKSPYTTLQRSVHVHPTVSELIPTLLGDLQPVVVQD